MKESLSRPRVLVVEDEPEMALGLKDNLEYEGYQVVMARDGKEGLRSIFRSKPDIVILDVMLPQMSGLDVCRQMRSQGEDMPVIILSARGQEVDKVVGLEVGADDYVTKPFSIKELLARIRAHLRRSLNARGLVKHFRFGRVEVDFDAYSATRQGQPIQLSAREFDLLRYLVERRGQAVTREQLLDAVWQYDHFPITRTVDNHIAKLRHKLEEVPADPRHILTVHRVGYKFVG